MNTTRAVARLGTALLACALALAAVALPSAAAQTAAETPTNPFGEYTPLTPTRILDTRTTTGGHLGKLGPAQSMTQQIAGIGGVPATGVMGVVMNVTATEPTAASHLIVWPSGDERPVISSLNYVPGETVPNLVTVALGADGAVQLYNNAGATHVIIDVVGYYADPTGTAGSRYHGLTPTRLFDTRIGSGGVPKAPLVSGQTLKFKVTGTAGVPVAGVTSVVMNVTETEPNSSGFVTVFPDGEATPTASNLNFVPGLTAPNLVEVKVPASGIVDFFHFANSGGRTHLLADVVGYYDGDKSTESGRFYPYLPYRVFDTRIAGGCLGPNSIGATSSANTNIDAVIFNVTETQPTASGYITVFPAPGPLPLASNLNYIPGQTRPNQVIVRRGAGGAVWFYNYAGCTHLIADAFGIFSSTTAPPPPDPGTAGAAGADTNGVRDWSGWTEALLQG